MLTVTFPSTSLSYLGCTKLPFNDRPLNDHELPPDEPEPAGFPCVVLPVVVPLPVPPLPNKPPMALALSIASCSLRFFSAIARSFSSLCFSSASFSFLSFFFCSAIVNALGSVEVIYSCLTGLAAVTVFGVAASGCAAGVSVTPAPSVASPKLTIIPSSSFTSEVTGRTINQRIRKSRIHDSTEPIIPYKSAFFTVYYLSGVVVAITNFSLC